MDKKYNSAQAHEDVSRLWAEQKVYDINSAHGPLYAIDTPPPTVSGTLHIGHVFSYTHTDIIARYKRMSGFKVFYPFGFDDNGLPTERFVEKKCGVRAHTMQRSEFVALCLQESKAAAEGFKNLWQRLGISADFSQTYSTISPAAQKISQLSFLDLLQKGQVYRRFEPAIYCTSCRTSVAQAELDDAQKESFFNTISFTDGQGNPLMIATTRPELLPSCVAVVYHPSDARFAHLHGTQATVPLFGNTVPIIPDELVDPEKGTGLVMVCTFGDKTDIEWYKKHALSYRQSIGFDGKMLASARVLAGLSVVEARKKVLESLKQAGHLHDQKPLSHSVGVHERCKNPVEYLLLAQWFVKVLPYKSELIALAEKIVWYPHFMKSRYIHWVENLGWDWCISRQRMYGIPFPVWHCLDCQAVVPAAVQSLPVDPQESASVFACPGCAGHNLTPDTDVMDTWNTSSLTPYIVFDLYQKMIGQAEKRESDILQDAQKSKFLPMAVRPQAHDIIRTWAFDTMVKSFLHGHDVPWNDIVISGHVLSDQKEKISKSKGNESYTPERLLTDFDADAIRYWAANSTLGQDCAFSVDQLKQGQRLVTKLWNAFLFAQPHLIVGITKPKDLGLVNEWLISSFAAMSQKYYEALDTYETGLALEKLDQFFWNSYCDNYIELVKNMLFNPDQYDQAMVLATRWTLYDIGLSLLQLYAPYMPYVTEAIYQAMYAENRPILSLHATHFNNERYKGIPQERIKAANALIDLASTVRKLKTERQLSLKTELAHLMIYVPEMAEAQSLETVELIIKGVTQARAVVFAIGTSQQSQIESVDGIWSAQVQL
jgi:valyl-tRNA synthetase